MADISQDFREVKSIIKGEYVKLLDCRNEDAVEMFSRIDVNVLRRAYFTVQIQPPHAKEQKHQATASTIPQWHEEERTFECKVRIRGVTCCHRF